MFPCTSPNRAIASSSGTVCRRDGGTTALSRRPSSRMVSLDVRVLSGWKWKVVYSIAEGPQLMATRKRMPVPGSEKPSITTEGLVAGVADVAGPDPEQRIEVTVLLR